MVRQVAARLIRRRGLQVLIELVGEASLEAACDLPSMPRVAKWAAARRRKAAQVGGFLVRVDIAVGRAGWSSTAERV
jgi:hypothetical protein